MFERFTDRARRVITIAQEEARALGHSGIDTDHVLLALTSETNGGIATRALAYFGVEGDRVRSAIIEARGQGAPDALAKHLPMTPAMKKAMELSLREALQWGHNYIGTEHILLGVMRLAQDRPEDESLVRALGLELTEVRKVVGTMLSEYTNVTLQEAVGEHTTTAIKRSRRRGRPDAATGPKCSSCSAELSATARYTTWDVPELNGKGSAPVLFLFCSGCGHTIDDVILPSE